MSKSNLFWKYLQPYTGWLALLAILLLSGIALQLASPQVIRYFLDTAQARGPQRLLIGAAALYVGFALFQRMIGLGAGYVSENLGWLATNKLRYDLALHCLKLDLPFHKTHTPGELIERIDGDITLLANFFSRFAIQITGNALLVLGILILLLRENLLAGLGLAVYTGLTLLVLRVLQPYSVHRWKKARAAFTGQMGFLEERISGAEEIRSTGSEEFMLYRLFHWMREVLVTSRAAFLLDTFVRNLTNLLVAGGYAFGLGIGVYLYTHGEVSIGAAYLIVTYIGMLSSPLQNIREQAQDLQQASVSIQRIQELFALQPLVKEPEAGTRDRTAQGPKSGPVSVEFREVCFGYEGNGSVIKDISFRLEPGKVLGVLGRTGSGKTTLTRLLFRLYDPDEGAVLLSGTDLRHFPLREIRRQIGMVTQDVQLFQASIRDNLTFFDESVSDERLRQTLQTLGIWDRLATLPGGLDASLAGGGTGLSAGEAQLLAFGRVYLKDPGLVILDEASSRLDPVTEGLMEHAIAELFQGRTGIVIAHRLETIQHVDEILILENGCVVEYGPRPRLAADPGSRFSQLMKTGIQEALA